MEKFLGLNLNTLGMGLYAFSFGTFGGKGLLSNVSKKQGILLFAVGELSSGVAAYMSYQNNEQLFIASTSAGAGMLVGVLLHLLRTNKTD